MGAPTNQSPEPLSLASVNAPRSTPDSNFTPEGIPKGGPARRALVRYGISVNEKGRVLVDTSREFQQAKWEEKSSYLAVK